MAGGRVEEEQLEAREAAAARGGGSEEEEMEDQPARLPEDVLAAIFHRVPPRWLAASRCVCRAWRDAVDGRGLLRADLLPLSLAGLFVHFDEHTFPEFFACPSSSAAGASAVSGDLSFLPSVSGHIYDEDCVHWGQWGLVSLVNNTYRVIKPPVEDYCRYGVVWILNESCGQTEWMLKHDKSLKPMLARRFYRRAQWILQDINYNIVLSSSYLEENEKVTSEASIEWNSDEDVEDQDMVDHCYLEDKKKSVTEEKLEWNSNDHNTLNNGDTVEEYFLDEEHHDHFYGDIEILGFHPYKEIVFLSASKHWRIV
ncbi:hypothetical protein ACQ4PT_043513 [Festuca glaucescens]